MKDFVDSVLRCESNDEKVSSRISDPSNIRMMHSAIGVCTEAGELIDSLKKFVWYGKPISRTNIIEELGDILWYVALMVDELNTSFEEVMDANMNKLKTRYPDKFNEHNAVVRDLAAEENALNAKISVDTSKAR